MCLDTHRSQLSDEILQHVRDRHTLNGVQRRSAAVPADVTRSGLDQRQQRTAACTHVSTRLIRAMQQSIEENAGHAVAEQRVTFHLADTDATLASATFHRLIGQGVHGTRRTNLITRIDVEWGDFERKWHSLEICR